MATTSPLPNELTSGAQQRRNPIGDQGGSSSDTQLSSSRGASPHGTSTTIHQSENRVRDAQSRDLSKAEQDHDGESYAELLDKKSRLRGPTLVLEIIIALIPLFFIGMFYKLHIEDYRATEPWLRNVVIAGIAAGLNKKPLSALGAHVQSIILVLPTLIPIVYAALMGKFFSALALYRSERGATLGMLERLLGCQSLFSTVKTQFRLRLVDITGLAIITAWALSPVAGQAALRLLSTQARVVTNNQTLGYFSYQNAGWSFFNGIDEENGGWPFFSSVYSAALQSPASSQQSSMDLWGNVKIPAMNPVGNGGGSKRRSDPAAWHAVNMADRNHYTSLLGIPFANIPDAGNSSFTMTSRYFPIECSNVTKVDDYNTSSWQGYGQSTFNLETNANFSGLTASADTTIPFSFVSQYAVENRIYSCPVNVFTCVMSVMDVESQVSCRAQNCSVVAMRESQVPKAERPPISAVALPNAYSSWNTALIKVLIQTHAYALMSSPTELWIANLTVSSTAIKFVDLSTLDLQTFSFRLQTLWNTWVQAGYTLQSITGFEQQNFTFTPPSWGVNVLLNTTIAKIEQENGQVYISHLVYCILLFIISAFLLLISIATVVLKQQTLVPDMLGYVSSLTRHPRFESLLQTKNGECTPLDGLARARALKDVRVIIGDVEPESESGYVALAPEAEPQRLRKGRLYR